MKHDPRPREQDADNYMRELEALGFSDRVPRSRDEAIVWQWQDEIRDQPTHRQLLVLLARVREDERDNCWGAVAEIVPSELWNGASTHWWIIKADALAAIEALGGER